MKKELRPIRSKWLTIRMTEKEYEQKEKLAAKTVTTALSDCGPRGLL